MSDAMTDSARASREAELYQEHLRAVEDYLKEQTPENLEKALETVHGSHIARTRPRFESDDRLKTALGEQLQKLQQGDMLAWANFLRQVLFEGNSCRHLLRRLKKLSPFAGQAMISVDYGRGFVDLRADIDELIEGKGLGTYQGQGYALFINPEAFEVCEVR